MPALLPVIYLTFVSLGLPDSALGAAWPSMYGGLGAGVSWVGLVSAIICLGTIASSVASVSVVRRLGTGKTSAVSVVMTAAGLMGFSLCTEFWQLCLWAIEVDAALLGESERALLSACEQGEQKVVACVEASDFAGACSALAELREPIDRFFEDVLVMDEDTRVRENRLRLLNRFASVFADVANIGALSRKK